MDSKDLFKSAMQGSPKEMMAFRPKSRTALSLVGSQIRTGAEAVC